MKALWFVEEIDFSDDIREFNNIDDKIKHFLKYILCFFHSADKLVANNICVNFIEEVNILEAQFFYRAQAMIEDIHSDTYSSIVDAIIPNEKEKNEIFNCLENFDVVREKTNWANKFSNRNNGSLVRRLIAFIIMEGIFFSGSFCAIYYIKSLGLLPGLCLSNSFIARDENLHCEFGCLLYSKLLDRHRLKEKEIHELFKEAIEIEINFITKAIPISMIGMNSKLMSQYVKFVCDFWLLKLGYKKLYDVTNPFPFMNLISINSKTNFFEKRTHEYQKSAIGVDAKDQKFSLDETDF